MSIFAIEVLTNHIKTEFSNGTSEDIASGVYERKDGVGDTVEQRPAVAADTERLRALVIGFETENPPTSSEIVEATGFGGQVEIKYADGTKEEVSSGIYERKNSRNETIFERAATQSDVDRLTELFNTSGAPADDDGTPDWVPGMHRGR